MRSRRISRAIADFFQDRPYRNLTISTIMTLSIGTVVYSLIEGWRVIDSLYFSVITLTTVGYGDLSPQTDFGKLFTIFYIITGVGIILGFVNAVFSRRSRKIKQKIEQIDQKRKKI